MSFNLTSIKKFQETPFPDFLKLINDYDFSFEKDSASGAASSEHSLDLSGAKKIDILMGFFYIASIYIREQVTLIEPRFYTDERYIADLVKPGRGNIVSMRIGSVLDVCMVKPTKSLARVKDSINEFISLDRDISIESTGRALSVSDLMMLEMGLSAGELLEFIALQSALGVFREMAAKAKPPRKGAPCVDDPDVNDFFLMVLHFLRSTSGAGSSDAFSFPSEGVLRRITTEQRYLLGKVGNSIFADIQDFFIMDLVKEKTKGLFAKKITTAPLIKKASYSAVRGQVITNLSGSEMPYSFLAAYKRNS